MGNVDTITFALWALAQYAGIGFIFAIAFLVFGLVRIDRGGKGAGALFKLMIIPGLVALWPFMLFRWLKGGQPHGE